MSDDRATPSSGQPPQPTFPWEHGYVAPSAPAAVPPSDNPYAQLPSLDVPAQAYHPTPDPFEGVLATDAAPSHADLPPDDETPLVVHLDPEPEVDAAASARSGGRPRSDSRRARRERQARRTIGPRWLMYVLGFVAAASIVTIVTLVIIVLQPKGEDPAAVPSGDPTAPAEEEPSEPSEGESVIGVGPTFDSFEYPETSGCEEGDIEKPIDFSWSSPDAVRAYIGVATEDARAEAFDGDLPPTHTYSNIVYLCDQESQFYTVSIEDVDGELTHKTVTITR